MMMWILCSFGLLLPVGALLLIVWLFQQSGRRQPSADPAETRKSDASSTGEKKRR
jgi:hypothetical protein